MICFFFFFTQHFHLPLRLSLSLMEPDLYLMFSPPSFAVKNQISISHFCDRCVVVFMICFFFFFFFTQHFHLPLCLSLYLLWNRISISCSLLPHSQSRTGSLSLMFSSSSSSSSQHFHLPLRLSISHGTGSLSLMFSPPSFAVKNGTEQTKKTKTKIFKMMKPINSSKRTNHKIINPKTLNIPPLKISYGVGIGEVVGKSFSNGEGGNHVERPQNFRA